MDWILDNFQIVALVGLALASWLKARMDAKAAEQEERRAREEMADSEEMFGPPESWEEADREMSPVPPIQGFPPPLPTQVSPPPLPNVAQAAEAALREQEALQRQIDIQERLKQIRESKAVTSGGAAATRARNEARQNRPTTAVAQTAAISPSVKQSLKQRSSIRRAIILREILGPPVSLRRGNEI